MSDIRSKPYSRTGRSNWDDIFGHKPAASPSEAVQGIVEAVRSASTMVVVDELREKLQGLVADMGETDRMRAFRVFNANVPAILIPKG